jgi:hypothetical protein
MRRAKVYFFRSFSVRAKRRGWITSSRAGVDLTVNIKVQARTVIFRWRGPDDPELDSWGQPKLLEHQDKPT